MRKKKRKETTEKVAYSGPHVRAHLSNKMLRTTKRSFFFVLLLLYTFDFICTKIMLYLECSLGLVVVRGTCNVCISVLFVWKLSSSRSSSSSIERQIDPVGNKNREKK